MALMHFSSLDRDALRIRFRANRRRSAELFSLVENALYAQPLELRHPFIFYLGHISAFHYNTLARAALGRAELNPRFDDIFRRGIDPGSIQDAQAAVMTWPTVEEVAAYSTRVDEIIDDIFARERLVDAANPLLRRGEAVHTILEHEEMHQETFVYIINRLDDGLKTLRGKDPAISAAPAGHASSRRIKVPSGGVTIGASRDEAPFGWDNEFDAARIDVAEFNVESLPVTNGDYLRFIAEGGQIPAAWVEQDGVWLQRTIFGLTALQRDWPVYVSRHAADAYCRWRGGRLMTEPEYQRAAYGTPDSIERRYPWGSERPSAFYGNFGFRRLDPEPVGLSPRGASAWGIEELMGNGWEWTSTPFMPLPGFRAMASYPQYSADFFDGAHSVVKGASPVTATTLLRPSLRNWFRDDYPYAYIKFRVAYDS